MVPESESPGKTQDASNALIDDKPEDELSTEERMAWLRQRGVVIEEPAGRKVVAGGGAPMSGNRSFQFVWIPADENSPCEELSCPVSDGDALQSFVGPKFAGGDVTDEVLTSKASAFGESVSVAAMRSVLAQGGAEKFRLAAPTDGNGRLAVYAYLDEASSLKGLPKNARASSLARQSGFPVDCVFHGDIYVGRQKWSEQGLVENVDFKLFDLEPASLWLRRAETDNLEFQKVTQPEDHARAQESAGSNTPACGEGEGYKWRDEAEELEVCIMTEKGITKRDVKVELKKQEIRILKPRELSLKLFKLVDVDGCNWTIGDGQIVITLEKAVKEPWPQLLA